MSSSALFSAQRSSEVTIQSLLLLFSLKFLQTFDYKTTSCEWRFVTWRAWNIAEWRFVVCWPWNIIWMTFPVIWWLWNCISQIESLNSRIWEQIKISRSFTHTHVRTQTQARTVEGKLNSGLIKISFRWCK